MGRDRDRSTARWQDYLQKRHVTVVIWLNEGEVDFEGGEFFFDSEEKAFRRPNWEKPKSGTGPPEVQHGT